MSEKRVNVKITASTSGFNSAIKKAQKQMEALVDTGEELGKSKFGDKATNSLESITKEGKKTSKSLEDISKKFKSIEKESKSVSKQLKDNNKAFASLSKIKFDKVVKQFQDIVKAAKENDSAIKNMQKTINSIKTRTIESVNKAIVSMSSGISNVSKGFTNVKNAINSISSKVINDVLNALNSLSAKCPALANAFTKIKTTINGIQDKVFNSLSSTVSSLGSKVQTLGGKFNTLKTNITGVTKQSLNTLTNGLSNMSSKVAPLTTKFTDLGKKIKDIASRNFAKLTESSSRFNLETTRGDSIFTRFANKIRELSGGGLSGFSNSMSGASRESKSFGGSIMSAISAITGLTTVSKIQAKTTKPLITDLGRIERKVREYSDALDDLNDDLRRGSIYENELDVQLEETEDALRLQKRALEDLIERRIKNNNVTKEELKTIRDVNKEIKESLSLSKHMESGDDSDAYGLDKLDKIDGWTDAVDDLRGAWDKFKSGDFGGAFKSLTSAGKSLFTLMPTWVKATAAVVLALKSLYNAGKQRFFTGLTDIKQTFQPVVRAVLSGVNQIQSAFESLTGTRLSFGSFIETAVTYEDTMARVQGITGATGKEFEALQNRARELGATTRYSASEVGQAYIEMGQQGWKTQEIMSGVEHVLNLATVGNIDLARSAEIVTNGLNAFGMQANEAQRYVDVLAKASTASGTSVDQLGQALEEVASTAGSLDISIEDTAAIIGLMGNNFIKSGKAGTSLKTAIANLASPSKSMTACIAKYNLEGARQKILNGDLVGGYADMSKALQGLNNEEKANIAATLVGKEGMAGFLSVINAGPDAIKELETAMDNADGVASHMAETFDATLKGALLNLSSGIQEKVLQVFDKIKPTLEVAMREINKFMQILNGMSKDKSLGSGLADGLKYLELSVKSHVSNMSDAIKNGISGIKNFITGGGFQSLLNIGSHIITGICDGIIKSRDSLREGIDVAISKISDWIITNGPKIQEAGAVILDAIKDGINNNSSKIDQAVDVIYDVINTWVSKKKGAISALGLACFDAFVGGILKGKIADVKEFLGNIFNPDKQVEYDPTSLNKAEASGKPNNSKIKESAKKTTDAYKEEIKNQLNDGSIDKSTSQVINKALDQGDNARENASKVGQGYISELQQKLTDGDISQSAYTSILNGLKQAEAARKGATDTVNGYIDDLEAGLISGTIDPSSVSLLLDQLKNSESVRQSGSELANEFITAAQQGLMSGQISPEEFNALVFGDIEGNAQKWNDNGKQIGEGMTYGVEEALKNMNVEELQNLQREYENLAACLDSVSAQMETSLSTIATSTRTEMLSCANITRNQFLNMANIVRNQCVNMANIVRNQFVNIANVVNNQALNARNNATRSFISMKSVISTQVGESRTVVVSKFMSIAAVVGTQSWNARDNACRAFMSLAAVIRTQMANSLSSVRSYMSQIAASTNRTLVTNHQINRTVATNYTSKNEPSLQRAPALQSAPALFSANNASFAPVNYAPSFNLSGSSASLLSGLSGKSTREQKDNVTLEIPISIDGRQIAKASAVYMEGELKIINDRKNRYAGGVR